MNPLFVVIKNGHVQLFIFNYISTTECALKLFHEPKLNKIISIFIRAVTNNRTCENISAPAHKNTLEFVRQLVNLKGSLRMPISFVEAYSCIYKRSPDTQTTYNYVYINRQYNNDNKQGGFTQPYRTFQISRIKNPSSIAL